MELTDEGKRPLDCIAACPTIRECESLTGMIRKKMKDAGIIQGDESNQVESFRSWNWTKQQLGNLENFQPGMKIFFSTKIKGIGLPGEMAEVLKIDDGKLVLSNGKTVLPKEIKHGIDVGNSTALPVGKGDIVRFTVNVKTPDYKINNGSLAIATGRPNEYILLDSQRREQTTIQLPENFKGIKYGWVMTSHVSQGMTSKNVVVAAEKMSKQAFYVACSRGKQKLALHVPDKEHFKDRLMKIKTERLSVHDLIASGEVARPILPEKPTAEQIKEQCRPDPGKLLSEYRKNRFMKAAKNIGIKTIKTIFSFLPTWKQQKIKETIKQKEIKNVANERNAELARQQQRRSPETLPKPPRQRPKPVGGIGFD